MYLFYLSGVLWRCRSADQRGTGAGSTLSKSATDNDFTGMQRDEFKRWCIAPRESDRVSGRVTTLFSCLLPEAGHERRRTGLQLLDFISVLETHDTAEKYSILNEWMNEWTVLSVCLYVCINLCLSDDKFRQPRRRNFTFVHPVHLQLIECTGVARICCEEGQRRKLCHGAFTVDFRAGCSSCLMTDSFVTCNTDWKSCELLTSASANLADYTILGLDTCSWLSDLLQSELKMKRLKVGGTRAPVPHSWRRHW